MARAIERQEAQLHGIWKWMATKAAYDRSVGEALRAQLDTISLRVCVDSTAVPQMPPYPKQLSRPWEPKEPPYDQDKEDDEEEYE